MAPSRPRLLARALIAVAAALGLVFIALAASGLGTRAPYAPIREGAFFASIVTAGLAITVRAFMPGPARAAWVCLSLSAGSWIVGNVIQVVMTADGDPMPIPSISDPFWLLAPPLGGLGTVLLIRSRAAERRTGLWLDATLTFFTLASISAAFVLEPILSSGSQMETAGFLTILAYPIVDVVALGTVLAFVISRRFQISPVVALMVLALTLLVISDGFCLVGTVSGTYVVGGFRDSGWLLAALAVAVGSQMNAEARPGPHRAVLEQVLPTALTAVALVVLLVESLDESNPVTIAVAGTALVASMARMALSMSENLRLLGQSRVEALTDPLTGLGNRRQLMRDLAEWDGAPLAVATFDLDGFKNYNDAYGHGAGDELLKRIGAALIKGVGPMGNAYRMGGDEFSAILPIETDVAQLADGLIQSGDGFMVSASYGVVHLPSDASDPDDALRIADARMYMCKFRTRAAADRQSADVLLAAMEERSLDLARHGGDVADLAERVAERLGVDELELAHVRHAARLHDIGKLAIPESIVNKPGPLSDEEWTFMRQHTVVGERIMRAAPALSRAATIVRSTHERWDGDGYPDGLAGEAIPVGARIVFACDALDAMTTDRVYRPGMPLADALDELEANAGTQFDPAVVEVLIEEARRSEPAPAPTAAPELAGAGSF